MTAWVPERNEGDLIREGGEHTSNRPEIRRATRQLSLAPAEAGQLSLATDPAGKLSLSGGEES